MEFGENTTYVLANSVANDESYGAEFEAKHNSD